MNNETEERLDEKYISCIKVLENKEESERTSEDIKSIQTYLNTLLYFRRLKLFDPINVDNTVTNISKIIKYVSIPKNNYVLKLGEKGNAFYLILKGKVSIMIVEYKKIYLTIEDYLIFLLKLFYFKENELLKETILLNKHRYAIDGDFENFIKDIYVKQKILENEIKKANKKDKVDIKEKKVIFTESLLKMIEKIFPDILNSQEIKALNNNKENISKDKANTINAYLDYIFNNNFSKNEVTPDKIISLINIDNYSSIEKFSNKPFSIPFYFQINELEKGKYFGHTALETNSKEEITIITLQDSSFGIIEKNDYFRLLSKINKELDSNFYTTLYCLPFFKDIPKNVFQKFYSSFFEYHLYKRYNYLYEMNRTTNILYLINSGRFSIYLYGNIIDLYNILIYLKTQKYNILNKNKKNLDEEEFNLKFKIMEKEEKDEIIFNKNFKTKEFNDAVFSKNEIYLGTFEGSTLIGLSDFVDKKTNTSLFNIKIESNYSELYEITQNNFNTIITDYSFIKNIIEAFEIKKLNIIINKIISYKNNFFSSLETKENHNILTRRNIQKMEHDIAIFNKTQKPLKTSRINHNINLPFYNDKKIITNNNKYITIGREFNNSKFNSFKTLGNKIKNKNLSEKKRRMLIKENILKRQDNEFFLLENRDINYKNRVIEFKKKLLSNQNSKKTFNININKEFSIKTNSVKKEKPTNFSPENKNNLFTFSDESFFNKIKKELFNNDLKNIFNRIKTLENKKEPKLLYINMIINDENNSSSKNLFLKNRNENNLYKKNNQTADSIRKKNLFKRNKSFKKSEEKVKKNKNILSYVFRNKESINILNQKINEYNEREKAIFDKLKINIKKIQSDINSSTLYFTDRIKILDSSKELNVNDNNENL